MKRTFLLFIIFILLPEFVSAQSGRVQTYSESLTTIEKSTQNQEKSTPKVSVNDDSDIIKVDTELIYVPTKISDKKGRLINGINQNEFKIFENGVEQEIAYFSNDSQPFTVALVLDMSYSSVFKTSEIQEAALNFIELLNPNDRVIVISFDEKVRVLCEATNNKKALRLAIKATEIGSGTSLYSALDTAINEKFKDVQDRKAVILLSDGVDTSSSKTDSSSLLKSVSETDVLVYAIKYDTFNDVQKNRRKDAQVFFDENDRAYIVEKPRIKGEREEDYEKAENFLLSITKQTGGRVYRVSTSKNLAQSFAQIADELRKIYVLGYYPNNERQKGVRYSIKVRVYRPNLVIRAKNFYFVKNR